MFFLGEICFVFHSMSSSITDTEFGAKNPSRQVGQIDLDFGKVKKINFGTQKSIEIVGLGKIQNDR